MNKQISAIHRSKANLDYQYSFLKEKFNKFKLILSEMQASHKNIEKIY
jgi:hypothetical protein